MDDFVIPWTKEEYLMFKLTSDQHSLYNLIFLKFKEQYSTEDSIRRTDQLFFEWISNNLWCIKQFVVHENRCISITFTDSQIMRNSRFKHFPINGSVKNSVEKIAHSLRNW